MCPVPAGLEGPLSCLPVLGTLAASVFLEGVGRAALPSPGSVLTQHGSRFAHRRPGNTAQQAACLETAGLRDCLLSLAHGVVQVTITKLKLDKDRKALLERKGKGKEASKGKFSEKEVAAMQEVD